MAITIYSTPTCQYCKMAKEYCKEHGIEFEDVNVADDHGRAREMVEKSGQMGVPVIVVPADTSSTHKEEVVIGFDRDRLAMILDISTV